MVLAICEICGRTFEKRSNSQKYCSPECRKIRKKQYDKEWYENNKENRKEYHKKWRENNKEYHKEYGKKWREKNSEYIKNYNKEYKNNHCEEINKYRQNKVAELNEKYDGDLNLILKDCPTTWLLREAIMQVEYDKSYSEAMYQKMKSTTVCEVTGESDDLVIHHIESFNLHPELGATQSNLVRIKRKVHEEFHSIYGYGNNTREQWIEFMEGKL